MVASPILSTYKYGNLVHHVEKKYINLLDGLLRENIPPNYGGDFEIITNNRKKIILKAQISLSFFHFFYDFIGTLLNCPKDDNPLIVFLLVSPDPQHYDFNFILNICKEKNIDYVVLERKDAYLEINNFYYTHHFHAIGCGSQIISEIIYNNIQNKLEILPTKKVYISRKKTEDHHPYIDLSFENNLKKSSFIKSKRIDKEELIENFFEQNGFEIIYTEDKFKNLKEQIEYFKDVKTIAGLSGAGFTNAIFMQPNTNMIEIISTHIFPTLPNMEWTEIEDNMFTETQHFFYNKIAFEKKQNYYTINNIEKKAEIVLDRIKSNKLMMELISE